MVKIKQSKDNSSFLFLVSEAVNEKTMNPTRPPYPRKCTFVIIGFTVGKKKVKKSNPQHNNNKNFAILWRIMSAFHICYIKSMFKTKTKQ